MRIAHVFHPRSRESSVRNKPRSLHLSPAHRRYQELRPFSHHSERSSAPPVHSVPSPRPKSGGRFNFSREGWKAEPRRGGERTVRQRDPTWALRCPALSSLKYISLHKTTPNAPRNVTRTILFFFFHASINKARRTKKKPTRYER